MKNPRFPIMRRVSPSGVLLLCLDQAAIGRHNHDDRVGLICEQDDGSEQPAPLESAENGNAPEEPSDDGEARLHRAAPPMGQLPERPARHGNGHRNGEQEAGRGQLIAEGDEVTLGSAIERRPEIRYSKNLLKLVDGLFHLSAEPGPGLRVNKAELAKRRQPIA